MKAHWKGLGRPLLGLTLPSFCRPKKVSNHSSILNAGRNSRMRCTSSSFGFPQTCGVPAGTTTSGLGGCNRSHFPSPSPEKVPTRISGHRGSFIHLRSAWRNCLIKPNRLKIRVLGAGRRGQRSPIWSFWCPKTHEQEAFLPFIRQFRKLHSANFALRGFAEVRMAPGTPPRRPDRREHAGPGLSWVSTPYRIRRWYQLPTHGCPGLRGKNHGRRRGPRGDQVRLAA
jgi:hypothetical protein